MRANCFARSKLGSISSLRCQKSRRRVPKERACEVMFSRTIVFVGQSARLGPKGLRRARFILRPCVTAPRVARSAKRGGARRDRTDDLMLAKHALSQLSYGPVPEDECFTLDKETHALDQSGGPGKT